MKQLARQLITKIPWPLDQLPKNTIPYIRIAIEKWLTKLVYSEKGW
jgi:hypothetical protein